MVFSTPRTIVSCKIMEKTKYKTLYIGFCNRKEKEKSIKRIRIVRNHAIRAALSAYIERESK